MQKFWDLYEKMLFGLLVLLFIVIPLYPKIPLIDVQGTFVNIRAEDFLIFLTLGLWSIYIIFSGNLKNFFRERTNQLILLFFFIGALSVFSAIFITQTVEPKLAVLHYLRRIQLIMLLPLALSLVKTTKQVKILFVTFIFIILVVNIYAFGQLYLRWPVITTITSELSKGEVVYVDQWTRVNSTFAGHYDLAAFLAIVVTLLTVISFAVKKPVLKVPIVGLGLISFFILVMTAARQSFLAAIFGILTVLWLSGKKKYILIVVILSVAAVTYPSQLRDRLISTITINIQQGGERYISTQDYQVSRNKLNIPTLPGEKKATPSGVASDIVPGEPTDHTNLGVQRSLNIRTQVEWPRAIRAFNKNPLLGTGYSSIGLATDNDLLRSLGEVGLLGTSAFILLLIEIIKRFKKGLRGSKYTKLTSIGLISLILVFLMNSLFIDLFEASKIAGVFWIIIGISLSVLRLKKQIEK